MMSTLPIFCADLQEHLSLWWLICSRQYLGHLYSYTFSAGITFVVFYFLLRKWTARRKIQPAYPRFRDVRREIYHSLLSMAVFTVVGLVTVLLEQRGYFRIYLSVDRYGWTYFAFSLLLLIFFHDTWFYRTHRAMHWKPLFRLAHRVHHQSHNPTPWAAFAFHPLEALVHALTFPLAALFIPMHPLVVAVWLLYSIVMNVFGHLGYEILPAGFAHHRLFRWHNTSVHHNMHHSRLRCNYGLYFNVWDRLMDTNHADYEEHFGRVTAPAHRRAEPPAGAAAFSADRTQRNPV